MEIRTIISGIFIVFGCFFVIVAAIGMLRMPDFFSRMHPGGKCDTLGQALVLGGLIIYEGWSFTSLKLLLIIFFIFLVNPTATHAIARAAYTAGIKPWQKGEERK